MIKVTVPATSANLGAGFDSCGLALGLYNTARMAEADDVFISSADGSRIPTGENNLVYRTAKQVYELCGKPFTGLEIVQENPIPMARGLGSSSACIAAGILGANALLGGPLSGTDVLTLATKLEGHPDNVAPALMGGFVVSAYDEGRVWSLRRDVSSAITFAAFIPGYRLLTKKARAALPRKVAHKDAVYNLSRAALLAVAFCEERYDFLPVATKDCLHQPYRMPLIPGGEAVCALAKSLGALAAFISGAGPTILAVVETAGADEFFDRAAEALKQNAQLAAFAVRRLEADNDGARVEQLADA